MRSRIAGGVVVAMVLAACSAAEAPADVAVADGWTAEVVVDGLDGPTQLAQDDDGTVRVATLSGGEDAGVGQVLMVGRPGAWAQPLGEDEGLVGPDGLLTPTGLAILPDTADGAQQVLVQEQVEVVRHVAPTDVSAGRREVVVADAPSNGRSQGTLTPVPGGVLAVRTGTGSGPAPAPTSGELYLVGEDGPAATVAVGFKNAYAHALGPDGALYVTEVGDGRYDGEAPPDELNVIPADVWHAAARGAGAPYDGGWPRCTGDADPTEEFGATVEECAALPRPVALFPPRSTPTSVAVTGDGRVLVALWVEGRVVEVDADTGEVTDVLTGVGNPQHLLAMPDGTVLLTVHDRGELWRLTPP